ncbi:GIY-YIG nuclease family protein [Candidatus Azambacteria bacterium]|nr:GIY-YIG nuclease family protein [Candidatus Azambacteria bacterium]MBI3684883.1 GIY-YIG nuclease family protein [Candidatus Azambacteria bacterium]
MFFVYIIKSFEGGRYYVGSCDNVEKRVEQHNKGRVRSTKAFVPWELLYTEKFKSRSESRNRERQLKSWKSREALERLMRKRF